MFDPGQIKSATANSGAFDPADPSILASRAPTFYSAALRAIEGAPARNSADGWKGWLDGAVRRGEMKQSERDWLGLDAWLDQQRGPVKREALADFIRANQVRIEEVTLGDAATMDDAIPEGWEARETAPGSGYWVLEDDEGTVMGQGRTRAEAIADAHDIDERTDAITAGAPKFGQYQLPGGQNYRELLLTMPPAPRKARVDVVAANGTILRKADSREAAETWLESNRGMPAARGATLVDRAAGQATEPEYRSSHWDQPNVLAHVRFNERTDADGKRVLFIEEIQSDWHQAGRKRGYGDREEFKVRYPSGRLSSSVFAT